MDNSTASQSFAAMGSPSRLLVLQTLVRAGRSGLSVGAIQDKTQIPASTLAHHLKSLTDAGLLEQTREGRVVNNSANFNQLELLADFILKECCIDES